MLQTLPHIELVQAGAACQSAFNILVAYESHSTLSVAKQTVRQVQSICGHDATISCTYWNFSLIQSEELCEHAATEVAETDMIIVAFDGRHDLPDHVMRWVERWPVREQTGQALLVALAGQGREHMLGRRERIAYLHRAAAVCGLDFLHNQDDCGFLDFPAQPPFRLGDLCARELLATADE